MSKSGSHMIPRAWCDRHDLSQSYSISMARARQAAHGRAKDGAGGEAVREDVARIVPSGVQAKRPQADYVHLLAAAPLDAPCMGMKA